MKLFDHSTAHLSVQGHCFSHTPTEAIHVSILFMFKLYREAEIK